jgi:hypothetical protein
MMTQAKLEVHRTDKVNKLADNLGQLEAYR